MSVSDLTFLRSARAFLLFFSVFGFTLVRAQTSDLAGTMPEDYLPELKTILVTALDRSPKVLEPVFEIEVRHAQRIKERSTRLPNLGSNISYGITELSESGASDVSSRDQGLYYSFGLTQTLFHWGALKNASAIANINLLIAEKNYARLYRDLAVLIRKLYLDLIVRKARVHQEREALQLTRDGLAVLKERLERGLVTSADIGGEELRIREITLLLGRSEEDLLAARISFARIAGIPELAEASIPDEMPRPVYSEALATSISATLMREGARSTIEAEIYDLRVREAQLRYNIEKVRLLPKFNAGAGYSLENTTTVGASVGQRAVARQSLSVTANWNIFDGLATRAAKMEAKSLQRLQTARREAELDALLENAQAVERQLKLDVERLELAEIRQGLAVSAQKRAAEEAKLDNVPQSAVDRTRLAILLAETNSLEARAALFSRWSEFIAIAVDDPVLTNLPASHVTKKK